MGPTLENRSAQFREILSTFNPEKIPFIGKLFGNIGLAVVLNFVVKTAWILLNNQVQDEIGHSAFGTYTALYALGFLFIAFSDFGLNQFATRSLAGNPAKMGEMFPLLLSIKIILLFAYPVFMVGVGAALGYEGNELWYLAILCFAQGMTQMIFLFRAGFQAFQLFRIDAVASVIDRAILLLIIGGLMLGNQISLDSFIWAGLLSVAISMVILYFFVLRIFGWHKPAFAKNAIFSLLKESLPFALITLLYSMNDKIDQVMLERIRDSHETGLYAGAYRWVDAVMMFLWTILPVFFARFAHLKQDTFAQKKLLDTGQVIVALPMIFISVFVFFFGDKLLFLFKHSTDEELATINQCLRILFFSVGVNGVFAIFSTLLTATGYEKFVSRMIFGSILISLVLNFIFIPQYGAIASSWITLVTYVFLSCGYVIFISRNLAVSVPWENLGKLAGATLITGGIFYLASFSELNWLLVSFLAGIGLFLYAWISGLVKLVLDGIK